MTTCSINSFVTAALCVTTTIILLSCCSVFTSTAFQSPQPLPASSSASLLVKTSSSLFMAVKITPKKKGYEPKWKKKETLADIEGPKDFKDIGLKGTIPIVFQQGTDRKTTMALPGQPIREVAMQAGQFIKYGCGKGECGTCECLVNGQWVRPCITNVPPALPDGINEYLVIVKEVKNKAKSSGKFYSVRSFLFGFYNNVLGMIALVLYRKNAKQNWQERKEYEDLIRQKALEKKRLRELERQQQLKP